MSSVKGLLKGLRYISQIFENEEEMQIGYPTDVKHVAHIGMDGPSANTPSWMNKYSNNQENSSMKSNGESTGTPSTQSSARDPLPPDMDAPVDSPKGSNSSKRRHSKRRHSSSSNPMGSPPRDQSDSNKPRRSKKSLDLDAPHQGSSHKGRRVRGSSLGSESQSQDPPGIPKSRRKKSKDGSTRSSRSKGSDSLPENFHCWESESGHGLKGNETCPDSVLKEYGEGNEIDEISRGVRAL